jgi:hypothetical protein
MRLPTQGVTYYVSLSKVALVSDAVTTENAYAHATLSV